MLEARCGSCPPPNKFNPVVGVADAQLVRYRPPFITRTRRTGRRAQGVKYEQRAHDHHVELLEPYYVPNQWFRFRESPAPGTVPGRWRWCEVDALLVRPSTGRITIIEYKYQHTSDAWWQLRRLYEPVVRKLFCPPFWSIALCEVVKWYDPAVKFPEPLRMVRDIRDAVPGSIGLHIWKP